MMSRQLKVLFVPFMSDTGHVNSCIGLAQVLVTSGHRPVFAVKQHWRQTLERYGIDIVVFEPKESPHRRQTNGQAGGHARMTDTSGMSLFDKLRMKATRSEGRNQYYIDVDEAIRPLLKTVAPDVIVWEQWNNIPALETSGIPWVWLYSSAPLFMYGMDEDVPPASTGLPSYEKRELWKQYRDIQKEVFYDQWKRYNHWMVSKGATPLKEHVFTNGSPFLNIYGFPKELDYSDLKPLPKHYIRFDNLMRTDEQEVFAIPDQLKNKPGKLIYLSLGTVNRDTSLLKRLIDILAHLEHRFVVSKGPLKESYRLPDNMWGQKSVPQLQVLSVCDLVITHGGNNTVCETFYFGKPMLVMPVSDNDQVDNAQRIHEKGLGLRLDPRLATEEDVRHAIDKLLNDKQLNDKLKSISNRIQSENSIQTFSALIEQIVFNSE